MSMVRAALALGLILCFAPARGDDSGDNSDSSLSKTSNDQRVKVTLLYVGPIHDPKYNLPFVLTFMVEDNRTHEQLQRDKDDNGSLKIDCYVDASAPVLKDGTHHLAQDYSEWRARNYNEVLDPNFKVIYPHVTLPVPLHPECATIFEYFYRQVFPGPYDILLQNSIPAYERNLFHFRDVETSVFH